MSINTLLNAIETAFNEQLTGVKTLEQFPGPFTVQAVVDRSFSSPAVFFGSNGLQDPRDFDFRQLNHYGVVRAAKFTAIAVGKHAKSIVLANREAMLAAEQIVTLLYKQSFGQDYANDAYTLRAEPMAAGRDKAGHLCFWRVTWWHGLALVPDALDPLIDTFDGYDADHFETDADTGSDAPKMESEETYQ